MITGTENLISSLRAECERLRASAVAGWDAAKKSAEECSMLRAGTPVPRPPRDESGPACPECDIPMRRTEAHRCDQCDVFTGDTQWLVDKARELEEAPAPPDHGAFRALAERWETDARRSDSTAAAWAIARFATELLALCSPVTRSEPTRAEVEREIADWIDKDWPTSLADKIRRGAYRKISDVAPAAQQTTTPTGGSPSVRSHDRALSGVVEEDASARDTTPAASSGAAEDQPQPACPHDVVRGDGRGGIECSTCKVPMRKLGTLAGEPSRFVAAERPRQGEPSIGQWTCACGSTQSNVWLQCKACSDPAPEAQRAQSEPALPEGWVQDDAGYIGPDGDRVTFYSSGECGFDGYNITLTDLQALIAHHLGVGTPAPNIAAAVAELEVRASERARIVAWLDVMVTKQWNDKEAYALRWARDAISRDAMSTEPPGGDKESER